MPTRIKRRYDFWKGMHSHWIFKAVALIWFLLGIVRVFLAFSSRRYSDWFYSLQYIPKLPWYIWIIVLLVLGLFAIFDGGYKQVNDLKARLEELRSKPAFTGHVYQIIVHPRTGIAPPQMTQELLDIAARAHGKPKTEYKVDCDVFVEAYIANEAATAGSIIGFNLQANVAGQDIKLKREPSFGGWIQMKKVSHNDFMTGEHVQDEERWEQVPDLGVLTSEPMIQGHGVEGWLHFVLEEVNPTTLDKTPIHLTSLVATDCFGRPHKINKSWSGDPRLTKIDADVQPAT